MFFDLHFLDARGEISMHQRQCLERQFQSFGQQLTMLPSFATMMRFDLAVSAGATPDDVPVSGKAPNGKHLHVTVDPSRISLMRPDNPWIKGTFFHETHHIRRGQSVGYGQTLGETLVSEGLACAFEHEIVGDVPPYAVALEPLELFHVAEKMRAVVSAQCPYDHAFCFFGREAADGHALPRWAGYTVGFALASAWLREQKALSRPVMTTAGAAVHVEAARVLAPWLEKGADALRPWVEEDYEGLKAFCVRLPDVRSGQKIGHALDGKVNSLNPS